LKIFGDEYKKIYRLSNKKSLMEKPPHLFKTGEIAFRNLILTKKP